LIITGAIYFSTALVINQTLQNVNMRGNKFGDDGITAISKVLENCEINLLNVRECGITLTGAGSLAEALSVNHSIRELWLMNNPITVEGACLILHSAVRNTVCQKVLIDNDYENDDEVKKMMTFMDNRKKHNVCTYCFLQ